MAIDRSLAASRRTSCSRCPEASLGRVDTVMRYRPPARGRAGGGQLGLPAVVRVDVPPEDGRRPARAAARRRRRAARRARRGQRSRRTVGSYAGRLVALPASPPASARRRGPYLRAESASGRAAGRRFAPDEDRGSSGGTVRAIRARGRTGEEIRCPSCARLLVLRGGPGDHGPLRPPTPPVVPEPPRPPRPNAAPPRTAHPVRPGGPGARNRLGGPRLRPRRSTRSTPRRSARRLTANPARPAARRRRRRRAWLPRLIRWIKARTPAEVSRGPAFLGLHP